MIALACLLALVAVAIVIAMVLDLSGATAILFSFVGVPALTLALLLYALARWRAGAFRVGETSRRL
ncbi:MAG: hypothetical protein AB1689_17860 [Thermodesulfobacteriota bacterium]